MQLAIDIIDGPLKGKTFEVSVPGVYLFGRGIKADLKTDNSDPAISREHFEIQFFPPRCTIKHLSRSNPTILNNKRIQEAEVADKDIVRVGYSLLRFSLLVEETEEESPEEPDDRVHQSPCICYRCGKNLDDRANSDKRAYQLGDKVTYCCPDCLPASTYLKNDKIGKYRLINHIATGGMGSVYLVYHEETARLLVLKRMLSTLDMDSQKKHFMREIKIHKTLKHKNIVHCVEIDFEENSPYMVLEYADSGNLHDFYMARGFTVPLQETISFFLATLEGCIYLHHFEPPIIHRDFKPWNLLLKDKDNALTVKISDFGLSKIWDQFGTSSFTRIGDVKGSLTFMSPQQLSNPKFANCQDDLFSLGVTFYYLLTGKLPYHYPSPFEEKNISDNYPDRRAAHSQLTKLGKKNDLARLVITGAIITIQEKSPHIPPPLAEIINRAIAPKYRSRYQTAAQMISDLKSFSDAYTNI